MGALTATVRGPPGRDRRVVWRSKGLGEGAEGDGLGDFGGFGADSGVEVLAAESSKRVEAEVSAFRRASDRGGGGEGIHAAKRVLGPCRPGRATTALPHRSSTTGHGCQIQAVGCTVAAA